VQTEPRLALAARHGLLDACETRALVALARRHHRTLHFAHGDLVPRNVLRADEVMTLIDWEWAGLHPRGYDEAFLWFSLQDVDGGRAHVERGATVDEAPFLLSALIIELWHLQWYVGAEFRFRHLETRDHLVGRLLGSSAEESRPARERRDPQS
jgi:aminoglycoside phosphotransferase (APT) family kinase protein